MKKTILTLTILTGLAVSAHAIEKTFVYTEYQAQSLKNSSLTRDQVLTLIKNGDAKLADKHSFQVTGNAPCTNSVLQVIPYLQPTEGSKYVIKKELKEGLVFESFADFSKKGVTTLSLKTQRYKARRKQFIPVIEWDVGKPDIVVYTELELETQTYIDNTESIIYTGSENQALTIITLKIIDKTLNQNREFKQIKIK